MDFAVGFRTCRGSVRNNTAAGCPQPDWLTDPASRKGVDPQKASMSDSIAPTGKATPGIVCA